MSQPYIVFSNVSKSFDRPVLVDCSFSLSSGKALAIHGTRGSGKSLILQMMMGFELPDAGQIIVAHSDMSVREVREGVRSSKKVAMISQSPMVAETLTVLENALFSLSLREDYGDQNKSDAANGLLAMVDLYHLRKLRPVDLSRGQRRMLALVYALSVRPECILFDQPTEELDPFSSQEIRNLLIRLKKTLGLGGVWATSDLELTELADQVLFLDRGKVVFSGTAAEFFASADSGIRRYLRMEG